MLSIIRLFIIYQCFLLIVNPWAQICFIIIKRWNKFSFVNEYFIIMQCSAIIFHNSWYNCDWKTVEFFYHIIKLINQIIPTVWLILKCNMCINGWLFWIHSHFIYFQSFGDYLLIYHLRLVANLLGLTIELCFN